MDLPFVTTIVVECDSLAAATPALVPGAYIQRPGATKGSAVTFGQPRW